MARQRISLTQNQKLQLNVSLRTAIDVLRMDAGGLTRFLEEQAAKNPYLAVEDAPIAPAAWLPRWSAALAEATGGGDMPETASAAPSLMAHVLSEIETLTRSPRERQIALVLAEALEPSGWLGRPLALLARQAGCAIGDAEAVLARLAGDRADGPFCARPCRVPAPAGGRGGAARSCHGMPPRTSGPAGVGPARAACDPVRRDRGRHCRAASGDPQLRSQTRRAIRSRRGRYARARPCRDTVRHRLGGAVEPLRPARRVGPPSRSKAAGRGGPRRAGRRPWDCGGCWNGATRRCFRSRARC